MTALSVAVRLTGGLGDVLMASPLVQAVHDALGAPRLTVHYHTPAIAQFVFKGARFVDQIRGHDELVTRGRSAADVLVHTGHFPRYVIQTDAAHVRRHATPAFRNAMERNATEIGQIDGLVKAHPRLDGFWARKWTATGGNYPDGIGHVSGLPIDRRTFPCLSLDPGDQGPLVLALERGPYITIHDGFDTRQSAQAGQATKCWPLDHWATLVMHLRAVAPGHAIIQVGAGKSRPIFGVDASFLNETTLGECAWILKRSRLHIDTDSGLAHLAHVLHTPAVVMFGPTNADYYGHATNTNIRPRDCGDCWWSTPDWLSKCPRGLATPACMASIHPFDVAMEAAKVLGGQTPTRFDADQVEVYSQVSDYKAEADAIVAGAGLTPAPVSEHIIDASSGIYVHASKQWEYVYAWRRIRDRFPDLLGSYGNKGLRIADVGGGRGAFAAFLADQRAQVTQFDRDYLWANRPETEPTYRDTARTRGYVASFGSIYNLPAADASFDVVLCVSVIEHIPEKRTALDELLRICRPGGIVVLTFDLANDPDRFRDRFRVDVSSPAMIQEWFHVELSPEMVAASAARIAQDNVLGIPPGMTVAGLTLHIPDR